MSTPDDIFPGIAVIGLAGRFPGAENVDRFWENLAAGREAITFWNPEDLRAAGVDPRLLDDPAYVRARGLIDGAELFDAAFFGLSPREAEIMDPQHRLLLECSWQALEHAGYDAQRYGGLIGVYAGAGPNTYLLFNLNSNRELLDAIGHYQAMLGSGGDFLATRVSYKLNLTGPSLTVQTACSTSLVAVHLAAQSLLNGECDMALAGGVRISVPQRAGYLYQPDGILSPDGHCRPFDVAAKGFSDGDGVGIVVLKRLAEALADGDHIHAVIRGSAINNDGAVKIGYTAPSVRGQAQVIEMAQGVAEVAPETVGYLEAHGTATPMGDPIEVAALAEVFKSREKTCALGSVKGNIGHLDAAAGVAGLIKTILGLEHRQLPPSLHFERPNPQLDLDNTPFFVNTRLMDWPAGKVPRRAGVSSFGIGGTNAHVVLEEAPEPVAGSPSRPYHLLLLSAATGSALEAATSNLVAHLRRHPEESLEDLAYTLQVGRRAFAHRRMVVCESTADGMAALDALDPKRVLSRFQEAEKRRVTFMFPGQGAQHAGMAAALYRTEPGFRREIDLCAEILLPVLGFDLREALDPAEPGPEAEARLARTAVAQPALFVVEYALARLWMEWGVRPEAMIGHSIGELVAACLAGVFTREEALLLVAARGRLMQEASPGAMLSVSLAESEVRPWLEQGLEVAAVNTPSLCVVAGPEEAVAALAARLEERGVQCRRLHTSHAFHSASMDPVLDRFRAVVARLRPRPPEIPFLSNRTGTWIRREEATDPEYWVEHLRDAVRFSEGLEKLFAKPGVVLLEVGPGRTLAAFALQHPGKSTGQLVLSSLPTVKEAGSETATLLRTLGQLWMAGVEVDWRGFYAQERRLRRALPAYPFERQRFWVEPREASPGQPVPGRRLDLADWFYAPLWKQALPAARSGGAGPAEAWLVFVDEAGLGAQLAARLRERELPVVAVQAGERFQEDAGGRSFELRPGVPEDYAALLDRLSEAGLSPGRIAHLWSVTPASGAGTVEEELALGFYSLLFLAQALCARKQAGAVHLGILSTGLQSVTGEEVLRPGKATLLGPVISIPLELPGVTCQSLDLVLPEPGSRRERELVDLLLAELDSAPADPVVAFRGGGRWLRIFEPLRLAPSGPAGGDLPLRDKGVYLITGGLGGVGLELAGLLARSVRARIVLTGRSPFPAREEWRERASEGGPGDRTAAVIRRLLALEDLGAEVLVAEADVTDRQAMSGVLELVRERFGQLHGVIHAAGVAGGGLIQLKTRQAAAEILAPKVEGTLVLADLLAGEDLDFLALCSSLTAILGGPGQVDYAAANAFLDAFAQAQTRVGERRVCAISWDTWRGLGMASGSPLPEAAARTGRPQPQRMELQPFDHPLLTQRAVGGEGQDAAREEIFLSYLQTAESWILAEHRLGGHAIVPGTVYLEMAGAAFRGLAGNSAATAIELSDVLFVAPMRVGDDERREVRTILRRNGNGFRFNVRSGPGTTVEEWQEHAVGAIRETAAEPARYDIAALIGGRTEQVMGEEYQEQLRLTGLGPRWESLKKVYLGEEGVLGLLELAPEFSADVEQFQLHPALLDVATGLGEMYVPRGEGYYLPLSYRRLRAHGPLPRRFWSHVRFRSSGRASTETIAFDIAILDEDGLERVQVEEFTLKRVNVAATIRRGEDRGDRGESERQGALATATAGGGGDGGGTVEGMEGMDATEAVEAFCRILAGGRMPQVAVSTHWLPEVIERARAATVARLVADPRRRAEPGHARPDLETAYVAPRNDAEIRLAGIWQEILGVETVGVFDNFFELGGHSLLGTQLVSRVRTDFQVEVPLARLFEAATVADFAEAIEAERGGRDGEGAPLRREPGPETPPLIRQPHPGGLGGSPLSFAQQRLWFLDRFDPGSAAYNMPRGILLVGALAARDRAALAASFTEIVRRHEILRTTFHETDGDPAQSVSAPAPLALPLVDLADLDAGRRAREASRLGREAARQPFDLSRGPLIRTLLIRLAPDEHIVSVVMHHIVTDGWSMGVFVREMWALYPAFRSGLPSPLPELPIQYSDFAHWQRQWLQGRALTDQLDYWKHRLANLPEELSLPLDRPRPAVESFRGGIRPFKLPATLAGDLTALTRRHGATLAMTLLAGFQALLARYSGQEDIAVGFPIAGRNRHEIEGLIGFFVNTLVFRGDLSGAVGFGGLLDRVRQNSLEAYANQDLPFEKLVEELHPERSLQRHPIFQVMFGFETLPGKALAMPGLTLAPLEEEGIDTGTAKFDLTMLAFEQEGSIQGLLEYNAELLEAATIQRLLEHFETLLAHAAADPGQRLSELPLLSEAEIRQLVEWNATEAFRVPEMCLHELIEAQVDRTPETVAVELEGQALTYGELDRLANRLAHHLGDLGVGPEVLVGICAERSLEMVVGLLAVLKAGGAYVPLDPDHPGERLSFVLEEAGVTVLLVGEGLAGRLFGHGARTVLLDVFDPQLSAYPASRPAVEVDPESLAYVIYTSGSTGRPKGAMNSHRAVINRLVWMQLAYRLDGTDAVLQKTPYSFDVSVWEFFWPLAFGARLVMALPGGHQDPDYLVAAVERGRITTLHFVPSMLQAFLEARDLERCSSLRRVIASGEALPAALVAAFFARLPWVELHNLYGPTEAAIDVTFWPCEREAGSRAVPIGRPIANLRIHLLDAGFAPVPMGVAGELYIGGVGVARGYVRRPDLTAERFLPEPLADEPGARMYRTGDLARFRIDGAIEYLGRIDHQVKIRGFRIELGEIEAVLEAHPGVRQSVVLARPDASGAPRLVAYAVAREGAALSTAELSRHLAAALPAYMVPASFVLLPALPLSHNGKVDRKRLPAPSDPAPQENEIVHPRTQAEELLCGIFADVLGLPRARVGIHDNFFSLGGHSLLATRAASRLRQTFGAEVPLRAFFNHPTVAGLEKVVAQARGEGGRVEPPLSPVHRSGAAPLSFAQQRLWFLDQLEPGSAVYNIPSAVELTGRLDVAVLAAALDEVVRRHEALRTTFQEVAGEPVQVVAEPAGCALPLVDLQGLAWREREEEASRLAAAEAQRPFDLGRGPLLRAALLRLGAERHAVLVTLHHIVSDGWSMGVLVRELGALYAAFLAGRPSPLPELAVQYADFAVWQRQLLSGELLESELAWWRGQLAGMAPALELPTDRPRPLVQSVQGAVQSFAIDREGLAGLTALSRPHGATLFMTLLAGFLGLLQRYTGEDDLTVGTPIAGRTRIEIEPLIGFFVNTLVLRVDLSGSPDTVELLRRTREATLSAYAHQEVPFERLVEDLAPERDLGRTPLVQVLLVLQNAPAEPLELPGLSLTASALSTGTAKLDLTCTLTETERGLEGTLEYSRELFESPTIERLAGHFTGLLAAAAADPLRRVSELSLLSPCERHQVLEEWNDTATAYPSGLCLHELIAAQAERTPAAVAASFEGESLTYCELVRCARQLARHLIALGVEPDGRVGVLLERSLEMIIGLLGVLEAGAAYVPLDAGLPAERLAALVESAGLSVILTQERNAALVPSGGARVVLLDTGWSDIAALPGTSPAVRVREGNLAYAIYTSGSTGVPKGVMIPHQGIVNRLLWMQEAFGLTAEDRVLQKTPFGFDVSVWEFFGPLLAGARLVFAQPEGHKDPQYLADVIAREGITILHFVPSMLEAFLEAPGLESLSSLRRVAASGEALPPQLVRRFFSRLGHAELLNLYGPTEASVEVSFWPCVPELPRALVPIGRPIANHHLHVVDRSLGPQPIGVPGELLLSGPGLARGYLGRPDLTAEVFIPDPFAVEPGGRLYRTGDLVRHLPDGNVHFLGRIDHQVKVRGFRIELGEIEAALVRQPGVREAVVLVCGDEPGDKRLVAYVVPALEPAPSPADLREALRRWLPEPMVPSDIVALESLPLTASGKVDRRALSRIVPVSVHEATGFAAPQGPVQEVLAGIWAEVLGAGRVERVGAHDDFFALGGHSLLATQVISRVREAFRVEMPLRALFESPTVAALAARIGEEGRGPQAPPIVPVPREGGLPLSFAQQRLWFLDRLAPDNPFYNMDNAVRLTGALDVEALRRSFGEIVRRHETLRTAFPLVDGRPVQAIAPAPGFRIPLIDLEALSEESLRDELARLSGEEGQRPFDLARGPLIRARLIRHSPRENTLLVSLHHIISDGWSMGILVSEIAALYGAFSAGEPSPLPELPIQYADFAVWQRKWLQGEKLEAELGYWRRQLAGIPETLELPVDHPRPAVESFRGGTQPFVLSASLVRELTRLTWRRGATLSMTMLAGFQALLGRYTGEEDIATGVAIANRTRREIEGLIGFFVNTLVVRSDLSGSPGFERLLAAVRETALAAYAHQDLPFERLVEELQPDRALNRNPLIQVMFGYQNFPQTATEVRGLVLSPPAEGAVVAGTAKFDLTLFFFEDGDRLEGLLEYNRELFEAATIRRLLDHYENLLAAAVAQPETAIALLPLLHEAERHQLTLEWNDTGSAYPVAASLQELFETQASSTPDALALLFGESRLSYGELNRRANRLAHRLRSLGVGPGSRVGLCLERSLEMVVGLLGIVKAGGAYVPLDPDYPGERLAFMMEDAGLQVLVGEEPAVTRLPNLLVARMELVLLGGSGEDFSDRNPPMTTDGSSLAYIVYTSGSTGRPKGVAVPHRAIVRLVRGTNYVCLGPGDRLAQAANISFDATTWEVWGALLNGAAVLVISRDVVLSSVDLATTLREQQVTSLFLTTALFNKTVREVPDAFENLREILFGGEAADPSAARAVLAAGPPQRLLHVYGPTESTTFASWHPVLAVPPGARSIPIGSPLANTSLFVLDRGQSPVPTGATGELCIGGDGLAWGYWNRPELTAERFVPHPWEAGGRLYRTGDLVRNRADGAIEFLGRLDHQVKIRGFRIEPGEIEARLSEHPAVLENVVLAREDVPGDRRLVAYVVQNAAYEVLESEVRTEQVSQWSEIFDDLYRKEASEADPTFNIIGWDSTYTGLPLPRNEMEEWLEDTIDRIVALDPRRVLEIGCGTGMILFRIAPRCELYTGTDVSGRALGYVESQLDRLAPLEIERSRVQLLRRSAEQLEGMEADFFDTVILNSVAQYFPSADYLAEVITRAVEVVRPGGSIFLGDLRSLPLLAAFHTSLELFQAEPEMPLARLRQNVQARYLQENELVIDPAFFAVLRQRLPAIDRVEVYPKRGRAHNELTGFRYQVVLRVGSTREPEAAEPGGISWLDWQRETLTVAALRRILEESQPEILGLRNVLNARVAEAVAATRLLRESPKGVEVADDLRRLAAEAAAGAVEPQDLWDLALELPYEVELSWASPGDTGCFEAVLRRCDGDGRAGAVFLFPVLQASAEATAARSLSRYANNPLQGRFASRIVPELRASLKERLPEYMVPSSFVLLDALPLTPNGKVDRRRLPAPDAARPVTGESLLAPRNPTEATLVEIWKELLGIERIGVEADFFELGGHSLLATQAVSRVRQAFGVELPLRTFFEAPTIAAVAGKVEGLRLEGGDTDVPPIVPVPREGPLPLSFAQERLWFLHRLDTRSLAYNESAAFRAEGLLDALALGWSLDEVLRRHESLRTTFPEVEGQAVQTIRPPAPFELPWIDLRELPSAVRDAEARRLELGQVLRPFDLAHGPLVRGLLVRLGEREHAVFFSFHHIVFDGWSTGIFLRELSALYRARIAGAPSPLLPLILQYADFASWQRQWLRGEALERQIAYWRERLTGVSVLGLATDRPRPVLPAAHSGQRLVTVPSALTQRLRAFSRSRGTTLFMTLLAGFQALLHRYTGQADIAVGSPIANRNRGEVEGLIGFFVNMLVLRTDLSGDPSFVDLLDRVRQVSIGAYAHQNMPFEKLVEELRPDRDLRRTPLFQVSLQLLNVPTSSLDLPGLVLHPLASAARSAKFDLDLALIDEAERLSGLLDYDADLFDGTTMERLLAHLDRLLAGALENPRQRLSELPLLTGAEHSQTVVEWNDTRAALSPEVRLHELFEAQAQAVPDAVALVFEGEELLYGELNARANQLAHALRRRGVAPGVLVGLCLERSLEMVIGLLGVLKAGGAYVPLDPSYPRDRLRFLRTDARTPVLLTQERLLPTIRPQEDIPEDVPAPLVLCLDAQWGEIAGESVENPLFPGGVDELAYVIYTSGSTGTPKGAMNSHRAICNRLLWVQTADGLTRDDRVLQKTPFSFDVSVWEFFWPLTTGARLILARPGGHQDPDYLVRLIARTGITTAHFVPSMLQVFLEASDVESCSSLRRVICSGEAMTVQLERRFFSRFPEGAAPALYNFYGPTEAAVEVTAWRCRPESTLAAVPIGRPIANTSTLVLDANLQGVPIGVPGELYLGGVQLALGYLDRPDLTAEKFVPDPFAPPESGGARLYRTGDQVRRLPGGEIVYLGRLDDQVKMRGFRIELGEIEAALTSLDGVREAVVILREDAPGDRRLVAYVTGETEVEALRQSLRERLPEFMVPTAFVQVTALPLNPNGKVDRKALPAPDRGPARGFVAPRTPAEEILAEILKDLLGLEQVGVHDNFFEIGGHSLLAVLLMARIEKRFGKVLPLETLFAAPTLESMATLLEQSGSQPRRSPLVAIKPQGERTPFFCVHPVGGNVLCYLDLARHLAPEQPFYALQTPDSGEGERLLASIEEMAARYLRELRRIQPEGPYRLGGWSMGGLVAFEMARQLEREGQEADLVALIDTLPPAPEPGLSPATEEELMEGFALDLRVLPEDFSPARMEPLFATFAANLQASRAYVRRPYSGSVTLFVSEQTFSTHGPELLDGWSQSALGGIETSTLPGGHYDLLRGPQVERLAHELTVRLAAADRERQLRRNNEEGSALVAP